MFNVKPKRASKNSNGGQSPKQPAKEKSKRNRDQPNTPKQGSKKAGRTTAPAAMDSDNRRRQPARRTRALPINGEARSVVQVSKGVLRKVDPKELRGQNSAKGQGAKKPTPGLRHAMDPVYYEDGRPHRGRVLNEAHGERTSQEISSPPLDHRKKGKRPRGNEDSDPFESDKPSNDTLDRIHEREIQTDLSGVRRNLSRAAPYEAGREGGKSAPTDKELPRSLRRVGGSKLGNDVSLTWLLEVNALFVGPPGEVTNPHFDAKARLDSWSERYDVDLVEVVAFFDDMESYLVKSRDGEYFLWENQLDILYKLGHTRAEVQDKLRPETDWDGVDAIDPHGIRECGRRGRLEVAKWNEYMSSITELR